MEQPARRPFLVVRPEAEKLAAFAAAVAHDLNDQLTVILNAAAALLREVDRAHPLRPPLSDLERAALRCAGITGDLLALTRPQGATGTVPLARFLE